MNKIFSYSLAACTAITLAASCKSEEDDIFDKSAAERLNEASQLYSERLCSSENGWSFEYYPNRTTDADEYAKGVGYLMMVKFNSDHSVLVGMNNAMSSAKYGEDTSVWEVITDMGAVLSFNTHNEMLHKFSDPESYMGIEATGKGMQGDYEFVIVDAPENAEHIMLKGKKRKTYNRLTRLENGVNFSDYLTDVKKKMNTLLSSEAPNHLVMNLGEKQYYFVMPTKGGGQGLTKLWPAGTDSTFTMTLNPLLMTRRVVANDTTYVIRFRDAIDASEDQTAQEFVYNPSKKAFVGLENESFTIEGEPVPSFFTEKWNNGNSLSINRGASSDNFKSIYDSFTEAYSKVGGKYTIKGIQLKNENNGQATLVISYSVAKPKGSGTIKYTYNASVADGKIKLDYVAPVDTPAENHYTSQETLRNLINALNGEFTAEATNNPLNLSTILLSKGDTKIGIDVK